MHSVSKERRENIKMHTSVLETTPYLYPPLLVRFTGVAATRVATIAAVMNEVVFILCSNGSSLLIQDQVEHFIAFKSFLRAQGHSHYDQILYCINEPKAPIDL